MAVLTWDWLQAEAAMKARRREAKRSMRYGAVAIVWKHLVGLWGLSGSIREASTVGFPP